MLYNGGKMSKRHFFLTIIVAVYFLTSGVALAAPPFYEGKTLRIIVGSLPGGGYDRVTRLLATHLPRHIPGKPTIIVENVPGAGSMIAANNLYNIEKPNGLTIGTFVGQGLCFAQLLKVKGVRFDLRKYEWIGSAAREVCLLTVRSDLPYNSVSDLRKVKEPIPLGTTGPATMTYQVPALLQGFAGLNFKLVSYPSSTESLLAVERKEVDGQANFYSSLKPYISRGIIRPLIRSGRTLAPGIENLPIDEDLTTDKRGKTLLALRSAADVIARPYVAPPNTPPEIMKILRIAFAQVEKDPAFLADAERSSQATDYVPTDEIKKVLGFILDQPEDIVREFGRYVKF